MATGYRKDYLEKLDSGGKLYESEKLKIMLGNAYGGRDMSDVAEALLKRFPSVRAILEAELDEILAVEGVPQKVALYLLAIGRADKMCNNKDIVIKSTEQFLEVLEERFRSKDNENVEIYFVNKSGKVTDIKCYTSGNADRVDISASELLALISSSNTYGIYFAHNHINCPAAPSKNDDAVTKKLVTVCGMCNIKFFDHCIYSSTGDKFSYLKSGRMEELKG